MIAARWSAGLALAVALSLAGCSTPGDDSPPGDATTPPTPPDRVDPTASTSAAPQAMPSPPTYWSNDTFATELTDIDTPTAGFQLEGANGLALASSDQRDSFTGDPLKGTVDHVYGGFVEVTWEASHPLLEQLVLSTANGRPGEVETTSGPSPLHLEIGEFDVDASFRFYVHPTTDASVQVRQPLEFHWSFSYEGDEVPVFRTCGCG